MVVTAFSSGDSLPVTRGRPVGGWHDAHAAIALQHRECLICSGLGASACAFRRSVDSIAGPRRPRDQNLLYHDYRCGRNSARRLDTTTIPCGLGAANLSVCFWHSARHPQFRRRRRTSSERSSSALFYAASEASDSTPRKKSRA